MPATERAKQALMGIGLLTVVAIAAVAAFVAYIWWDSKTAIEEEFETDAGIDEVESGDEPDDVVQTGDDSGKEDTSDPDDTEVSAG